MTTNIIHPLLFDSNLFGYPVGKFEMIDSWDEDEFLKHAEDYSLVYLFSKELLPIQDPRIRMLDEKLIFQKTLSEAYPGTGILTYEKKELDPRLKSLAFQSGIYSRFKRDSRLQSQEFEKLYSIWIQKAFEQDTILTDTDLKGMITYSVHEQQASIGLFAVSEKARGMGLGSKLIQAAESEAEKKGAKSLSIPTQAANIEACRLYTKLGYKQTESTFIYHFIQGKHFPTS